MRSYTFRWPHDATEVFVTGTFDDWGKTIRLEKKGEVFEKEVQLSTTDEKLHYKFVVDGIWTTDSGAPEEDDGGHNINNVLYPDQPKDNPETLLQNGALVMAGVTPDSTTAALAEKVSKESTKHIIGDTAFSSTAPGSAAAELANEQRGNVPGEFPPTPGADQVSVNPIPASAGAGNPISLKPGEKVPDPSTFNPNTIQSTVRTDEAGYNQDASYPLSSGKVKQANASEDLPAPKNLIPESSLPMGEASQGDYDPATIQSVAPTSTTAGLAAAVPLESQKKKKKKKKNQETADMDGPVSEVPEVVKKSMSEAHQSPEAAANQEAVDEKNEVEKELQDKVPVETSAGTPAPGASAAATAETAPHATESEPKSTPMSPRATTPSDTEPTMATGAEGAKEPGPEAEEPKTAPPPSNTNTNQAGSSAPKKDDATATNGTTKAEKRRSRVGLFFQKIKEKLK